MKRIITWILVADGFQARLFCNDGPGRGVAPLSDDLLTGCNLPGREIMSDRPGWVFDSAGQGRHAKEPRTDPREAEKIAKNKGVKNVHCVIEDGDPVREILGHAEEDTANLIVMGSRGLSDLQGLLMGSVSHKVSQLSPCSCITVK